MYTFDSKNKFEETMISPLREYWLQKLMEDDERISSAVGEDISSDGAAGASDASWQLPSVTSSCRNDGSRDVERLEAAWLGGAKRPRAAEVLFWSPERCGGHAHRERNPIGSYPIASC